MENRTEHNPPEPQGWKKYITQEPQGQTAFPEPIQRETNAIDMTIPPISPALHQISLCTRVQEKLQLLIENDESVRPEMSTALYGHLAVCADCAKEFEQMQRIINLVEALPLAEMPMDYSHMIMRRIELLSFKPDDAQSSLHADSFKLDDALPRPTYAVSSLGFGEAAIETNHTLRQTQAVAQTYNKSQTQTELVTASRSWERLAITSLLSLLLVCLLNTGAGRQIVGSNLDMARQWFIQIGEALSHVPVLGWIVSLLAEALSSLGHSLEEAFQSLSSMALQLIATYATLFAVGYYFMVIRKQRAQFNGR